LNESIILLLSRLRQENKEKHIEYISTFVTADELRQDFMLGPDEEDLYLENEHWKLYSNAIKLDSNLPAIILRFFSRISTMVSNAK
jgi:hypothetical protein